MSASNACRSPISLSDPSNRSSRPLASSSRPTPRSTAVHPTIPPPRAPCTRPAPRRKSWALRRLQSAQPSGTLPRGMSRRVAALLLLLLPGLALAQYGGAGGLNPEDQNRNQLRDRLTSPTGKAASKVKLDEALRNFNSDDLPTRLEGVQQLGQSDDEAKAVGYLLQAANDPDMAIRLKAIDVLGTMRAKDSVGTLVQQLFMRGTETTTKQHILVALGKIGDQRATKPILDFLAREGDRALRGNAIYALGDIGDQEALGPLNRIAGESTDPTLRSLAQTAVHKINNRPGPEVVPSALAAERYRQKEGGGGPAGQTP